MGTASFRNVDEYIAAQPEAAQAVLEQAGSVIRMLSHGSDRKCSRSSPILCSMSGWPSIQQPSGNSPLPTTTF